MASVETKTNEKQILIILSLIRSDCVEINAKFNHKKTQLFEIIKNYEVFMFSEINSIFQQNNHFSGIVRQHRKHFIEFLENNCAVATTSNDVQKNSQIYVHISVQEWFLQGQKGQQFRYLIDIDCLNFDDLKHEHFTVSFLKNKMGLTKIEIYLVSFIVVFATIGKRKTKLSTGSKKKQ